MTPSRRSAPLAILPLLVPLALGCAQHQHRRLGTAVEPPIKIAVGAQPTPLERVRLLKVMLQVAAPDRPARIAPAEVVQQLARALRAQGGLDVTLLPAWLHGRPLAQILPLAASEGMDALVTIDVTDFALRFEGYRWVALPNLILWAASGYPSHWAHDARYRGQAQLVLGVWDVPRALRIKTWRPAPGRHEDLLNYHERTRGIWPYLVANLCPPVLYPDDARALWRAFRLPLLASAASELGMVLRELPGGRYRLEVEATMQSGHRLKLLGLAAGQILPGTRRESLALEFEVTRPGARPGRVLLDGQPVWPGGAGAMPEGGDDAIGHVRLGRVDLAGPGVKLELEDSQGGRSQVRLRAVVHEAEALGPSEPPAAGPGGE